MRVRASIRFSVALATVVLSVAAIGCGPSRPAANSRLRVLFTGETLGELEPCNCSGKMAGGLPVRGGYIAAQPGQFLLLDVGCVGNGVRDFEVLRAQAALRGMKQMGYDAVNIGEHELWLGRTGLNQLMGLGVPFVSANSVDESGSPAALRYLILKRSGLTVAVTGLVDDSRSLPGPGLRVTPPRETLARLIPELREKAGVIVLLADLDLDVVRDLAHEFPELSLILFRGKGDSHAPELVNRTVVASIYGEARYIGDLTLSWQSEHRLSGEGKAVLLDDRFPPSLKVIPATIEWYKSAIRGRAFDLAQQGPGWDRIQPQKAESGNRFIGSDTCAKCHPYQYPRWKDQRHARAMQSLQKGGYEWSPECVVCHTVGYGSPDGYTSMADTPQFANVGCEDCHGRGLILQNGRCKGLARRPNEQTCRQCHTMTKHAAFNYATQWAIINHKEPPK